MLITVDDEGCGIAADDLDEIFQPFRSTFDKGTGLGLPIVHRIVTDYGGAIQVSSTAGAGTSIHVRLPHRDATGAEAPMAAAPAGAAREFARRGAS